MPYNYNNNPYQYSYNNYGYQQPQQMQPQYNPYMQPQPQPQIQQQTQNYLPLTFVSGIEGAKAFFVPINQVVFLKDSDSDLLFQKKADSQGKYEIKTFRMTEVDVNNPQYQKQSDKNYITVNDLNALEKVFADKIDKLSIQIEKLNLGKPEGSGE